MATTTTTDNNNMTGVFRSEKMLMCQLLLQSNVAMEVTCDLGEQGIAEIRDLNTDLNAYQKKYVEEIRRMNAIESKLTFLRSECDNESIEIEKSNVEDMQVPGLRELLAIETRVEELDKNLRHINGHLDTMMVKKVEYYELTQVLHNSQQPLEMSRSPRRHSSFLTDPLAGLEHANMQTQLNFRKIHERHSDKLNTVTGIIRADKILSFHAFIWRLCGNNALVQFYDIEKAIEDVTTHELIQKKVFLIICQGEKLLDKIMKICAGYRASIYEIPETQHRYEQLKARLDENLRDVEKVIEETQKQKLETLMVLSKQANLSTWLIKLAKLRAVYAMMNFYKKTDRGFIVECWCAQTDYSQLTHIVQQASLKLGVQGQAAVEIVSSHETPPTYYRTNKFTQGFQNIVESYGVASYREMNPAPYTIITFPFLFAIMFGDAGHGLLMLLFALWMVLYEKRLAGTSNNEIWLTFFDGRYIILLMGMFSIYTGIIYNDVFSKSMNIFRTYFDVPGRMPTEAEDAFEFFNHTSYMLTKSDWTAYPFGIDPIWQISQNKILFLNSFKMKLSVILGVCQMLFGVMLSLSNHINLRNTIGIVFEFIPQVIFLLGLFGYLIVMVFMKWLQVWASTHDAPSILIDFINMFLMKYPSHDDSLDTAYLVPWYPHKQEIQTALLLAALLCVPVMLLAKPIILVCCKGRRQRQAPKDVENGGPASKPSGGGGDDHENESTGDIFIHQAIHTIEYCLGSISHTASYLRLWALSLAHSQLSDVLWGRLMKTGLSLSLSNAYLRGVACFLIFAAWAILTLAILIVMEGLSAFLHALRLHWVEFQSKFYQGNGYLFKPFKLKNVMLEQDIH